MEEFKWIEINPEICDDKPVIRRTRIPVKVIIELLANGWNIEDIKEEYDFTEEHIRNHQICISSV